MSDQVNLNQQVQSPAFPKMSLVVYGGKVLDSNKIFEIKEVKPHELSSAIALIRPGMSIVLESYE